MADIPLDALSGGGEFKALECSGTLTIASGTSGTLVTLTSTGGRKIRLTMLAAAPSSTEAGISVLADGVAVISSKTLNPSIFSAGAFTVGAGQDSSGRPFTGNIQHIEANSTITITKASGSTASTIFYATEQGF
jgi:hypothetical protein